VQIVVDKIQRTLVCLMLLEILILIYLVMLSNDVQAQSLNNRTLSEVANHSSGLGDNSLMDTGKYPVSISIAGSDSNSNFDTIYVANLLSNSLSVISGENNTKIKDIDVGDRPSDIGINELTDIIYVLNYVSRSLSVISVENNTKIKDIDVGFSPSSIGINDYTNTVYVANKGSKSISVISGENNTKIKDIFVKYRPEDIGVNLSTDTIYVVNEFPGTVSVINGTTNTQIGDDIVVGKGTTSIGINDYTNTIYVANRNSDTVSVINGTTNTKIGDDIVVGDGPRAIGINDYANTIYVANERSNGISVIDGVDNKVVAGITFDINPFDSGYIKCDEFISPLSQYFYMWSGTNCIAIPNQGFEFVSWQENLIDNATQFIQYSSSSSSTWGSILDFFGIRQEKPEATLNVTKFGSFTANFKELPPPLPAEYWATLFGFVLTTGLGAWLIPSFVRWTRTKADTKKSNYYHQRMKSVFDDNKLNEKDMKDLDDLERDITDAHSKGKINEIHYSRLKNEISVLYEEIFKKRMESLNSNEDGSREDLQEIGKDVNDAHSKGKINEIHYNNLINEISIQYNKIFRKKIDSLKDLSNGSISKQLNKLKEDIEIAHSEQKITETQFTLLNKRISDFEPKENDKAAKEE
jgi:YVTN family beta-propeller protein